MENSMGGHSATNDIQIMVGKDLSTATLQGVRIEVSPDSNVVVYTNEGVQTKPASSEAAATRNGAISEGAVPPAREDALLLRVPAQSARRDGGTHISADFNTVVLNGATIERADDGHLVISTPGSVIIKPTPANDTAAKVKTAPEAGDVMADGTIFAGISPDTQRPMYATPADAPATYTFNEAAKHAKHLAAHGHRDFRVPSKGELNVLWENRNKGALKGTFNETGSTPAGWYWSSSPGNHNAWAQLFDDGYQRVNYRHRNSSLRCVR
jgi:hypothetical protein